MPYRRYRRRSWRPRYRRRYRRRGTRRFINGSSRSVIRAKVPYQFQSIVNIPTNSQESSVSTVINPWRQLVTSPLYRAFANLYDEVKLIGWKVAIATPGYLGQSQLQTLTGFKFITGIDRRFCYSNDPVPSLAELKQYASQKSVEVVWNSVAKFARSCYASDLIEKAQWHDSEVVDAGGGTYVDLAYAASGANCNFFSPAMFVGCETAIANGTGAPIQVYMSVDITFYVAFRNPKYGGTAASKVLSNRVDDDNPNNPPDDDDDLDRDDMADDTRSLDKTSAPAEKRVRVVTADDPPPNLDAPPSRPSTLRQLADDFVDSARSEARETARRVARAAGQAAVRAAGSALTGAAVSAAAAYRAATRNGGEGNPLPFEPEYEDTSRNLNASAGPLPSVDNDSLKETPQPPTHAAI